VKPDFSGLITMPNEFTIEAFHVPKAVTGSTVDAPLLLMSKEEYVPL
jgi:hypothetical protein